MSSVPLTPLTQELETFYTMTSELVQPLELSTVLERVLSQAIHLLRADGSTLFLYEIPFQHLRVVAAQGLGSKNLDSTVTPGEEVAGRVWQSREALHITNYTSWEGKSMYCDGSVEEIFGVPLCYQDECLGVLLLLHAPGAPRFTERQRHLLTYFAAQATTAINHARLFAQERKKAEHLTLLHTIAQEMTTAPTLHAQLEQAVTLIHKRLGYRYVSVILLDRHQKGIATSHTWAGIYTGTMIPALSRFPRPVWGLVKRVALTGTTVWVGDVHQDPGYVSVYQEHDPIRSALCLPLKIQEEVIGILNIKDDRLHAFDITDVQALEVFSGLLAHTIERARLLENTQHQLQELTLTKTYLASVLEQAGDAILTIDPHRTITAWNHAAERLFGYTATEAIGQSITLLHSPQEVARIQAIRDEIYQEKQPYTYDTERLHKDGTSIPVSVTVSPILDEARQVAAICSIYRDLRERKQWELQLVQAEKFRALGEMASGVAHDFNNLLTTILGRTQLLLARIEDEETQDDLRIMEKAALDGAETVRRLQQFSRGETPTLSSPVQLHELITEALEMTRPRWKDKAQQQGIQITPVLELAALPPTMGNPAELREVLTNLIFNAIDAMPEGGTLTFRTWQEQSTLYCSVRDTGIGMSPEVQGRVFEPFFTTKEMGKGTGMGLSTVYGILTAHGGEIIVESQPGQGTTFTFSLPLVVSPAHIPAVSPPSPLPAPLLAGRILVIEDEDPIRELLREVLHAAGHQVTVAATGREALTYLQQQSFDLVLTDLGLPEMNGWEVARHIRQYHTTLSIMMVTGWGRQVVEEEQEKLRSLQINRVMAKPFEIPSLLQAVQEILATGTPLLPS